MQMWRNLILSIGLLSCVTALANGEGKLRSCEVEFKKILDQFPDGSLSQEQFGEDVVLFLYSAVDSDTMYHYFFMREKDEELARLAIGKVGGKFLFKCDGGADGTWIFLLVTMKGDQV